jgi:hypothetical protein
VGSVRNRLVDGPDSVGAQRRARRWEWLREAFPQIEQMSVIDLGGTAESWLRAPLRPARVHVVNLEQEDDSGSLPGWLRADQGDACELPAGILSGSYDLVFSNSVIEHVGGHAQRLRFAEAVHKLADRHWVQTPYRYFPVEPHWLFPGFQFLPLSARARVAHRWPLAHTKSPTVQDGLAEAMSVELLSRSEMAYYFPHAELRLERMLGVVKSLIAVRR